MRPVVYTRVYAGQKELDTSALLVGNKVLFLTRHKSTNVIFHHFRLKRLFFTAIFCNCFTQLKWSPIRR